jgi:hypothetical protein
MEGPGRVGDFAEAISTRIWESVGRANWRKFEDARAFVRKLGLKNGDEWREYRSSDRKPADIPAAPDDIYAEAGWAGYGDWLGTGNVAFALRQYQPFNRARAFARGLGLKSTIEWRDYCKSGKKPSTSHLNQKDMTTLWEWTIGSGLNFNFNLSRKHEQTYAVSD